MALTPEQFAVIQNALDKADALQRKATEMKDMIVEVAAHSNPDKPVNQDIVYQNVVDYYAPLYAACKADVQAAFDDLP